MLRETYDKVLAYIKKKRGTIYERPLLINTLEKLENSGKKNFLINAPTGYGKSLISMSVALHEFYQDSKTIIAYPLRALIEQQLLDIKEMFAFHGISKDFVGARHMGSKESIYLVHPITLTTVDTLSLTAMGLSPEDVSKVYSSMWGSWFSNLGHYLFSWSSIFASTYLILDEVHLMYDSSKSLSFLKFLMNLCELTGVIMIFMTATFPKKFESVLSPRKIERVGFSRDDDPEFYDERNSKKYRIELLYLKKSDKLSKIREVLMSNDFKKALVIFNTVEDAVSFYRLIDGKKLLIHSRFTNEDKKTKISELGKMMNSDEKYVVIGTQAIEAGVDVSSDLIITEISPPISLVQRFGRFLRYNERFGKAFVWIEEDVLNDENSDSYKVYDKELVKRTLNYLSSNNDVNLHISYDDFMNYVYLEEPRVNNEKLIKELMEVMLDLLRPTHSAMELFLKMEGSFVREGSNFTVVSEDESGFEVELNVSFDYIYKLRMKGLCDNCPENAREALERSLKGEKFRVYVRYNKEVGLA